MEGQRIILLEQRMKDYRTSKIHQNKGTKKIEKKNETTPMIVSRLSIMFIVIAKEKKIEQKNHLAIYIL